MSRLFTGSAGFDQILQLAPGAVPANGPLTYLWLWIPKALTSGGIFQVRAAGNALRSLQHETDGQYYSQGFAGFLSYAVDVPAIVGYSKAAGEATVRWHGYRYDTATWAHVAGESFGDGVAPDELWIGRAFGRMDGVWIAGAAWSAVLSDAAHEAAGLHTGLAAWAALAPAGLWAGNQAAATDPVTDLTGNGADQIGIIGPAPPPVSAEEPPGWSYDLGAAEPVQGAATLTATGTLTAAGRTVRQSAAALTGIAAVSAVGRRVSRGQVALPVTAGLAATGRLVPRGVALLAGAARLAVASQLIPGRLTPGTVPAALHTGVTPPGLNPGVTAPTLTATAGP